MDWDRLDEATIRQRLAQAQAYPPDDPYPAGLLNTPPQLAAVLVPFVRHQGRWHLLFIRRAENPHDPHSGQVSFPGGHSEDGESPTQTALREAEEELALAPHKVRLLGQMPRQRTISNYWITPLVGVLAWPVPLRPAPAEVSHFFLVPLAWLADPTNREIRVRKVATGLPPFSSVYYRPYQGEIIWGATARMVLRLLDILRGQGERPVLPTLAHE